MRNSFTSRFSGLLGVAALGLVSFLTPSQMSAASFCGPAVLAGTYAAQSTGTAMMGPVGAGPFVSAGRWIFDGAGNVTVNDTINYNGNVLDRSYTGTYVVDSATCRATVTFSGVANGDQATVYPTMLGTAATFVVRTPTYVVVSGSMTR